jgi:hypothetical protein
MPQFIWPPQASVVLSGNIDSNTFDGAGNPISSTAGALNVNASNPCVGTVGSPAPASAALAGFQDPSNNLARARVNAGGEQLVASTTIATETTLAAINTKTPSQGQALMAASSPVVIASNQSAVPVSGPLTDVQLRAAAVPVSASALPLPTGAATEATLAAASAKLPATLGQKAAAASLAVVLASDQAALPQPICTSTFAEILNLTTTAQTFTAPANTIGFMIQAPFTNTDNVRWKVGGTATLTSGMILEPGRSEDFRAGGNISVIATAGTNQVVFVQWVIR